jgi:CBS domain containing-hemolysin-like protein
MSVLFPLLVFLIALALQGLFAGYETGFVSSNPIRVRYLAEEEHSSRAARLLHYLERPAQMLTALLIGTNLMVVTCTVVVSFEMKHLDRFLPPNVTVVVDNIISTAILVPVMLVFAEIMPKSVFRVHPNLTITLFPVIRIFYAILAPVAAPTAWATRGLLRLFGGASQSIPYLMSSREDVRDLVDESVDHGAIKPDEQEMIHSVIDLQATTAKEIMVPRIAIQALPDTATRSELVAMFVETGRTRIPIYHESIDHIVSVVSAYAILSDTEPEREDIGRFRRDIMHVPDTMRVDDLFQEMKKRRQHIAIVTDEYGGTDGLVTIEDILEEIFGEIQDEYDNEESPIHKLGPNAYVVDARTPLEDVAEVLGIPIADEEVETVGGWLIHVAGHIPSQGHVIEHDRFRMTVLAAGPSFVSRIRLEILSEPPSSREPKPGSGSAKPDRSQAK